MAIVLNKKKKILFLEQYVKLTGGQQVLLGIIAGLDKDRYKIFIGVPEQGELTEKFDIEKIEYMYKVFIGELTEKLDTKKIEYMILPMGYYTITQKTWFDVVNYLLRAPFLVYRLLRIIKKEKIDLVYANGARTFVWGTIACSLTKTPIVWHLHSMFKKGIARWLCLFFGSWHAVKKIITVSETVKEPLSKLGDKIEVVYNGIDTRIFHPNKGENRIRQEFNCPKDETLIAVIGLLVEWKNQEDLIRAARLAIDRGITRAKFLIIGEPLHDDRKGRLYKERLERLVKTNGLQDKVVFTGYRSNIPQIMKELDILVLTSKDPDPCPMVLLEGMGSGVAVIATNFGGPAEIIEDYQDGLLYTPGDYKELADKIVHLLKNDNIRLGIKQRASLKIREKFSQENYIKKINEIINSCAL